MLVVVKPDLTKKKKKKQLSNVVNDSQPNEHFSFKDMFRDPTQRIAVPVIFLSFLLKKNFFFAVDP